MAEQKGFRSGEERLEAITKNEEIMRASKGFSLEKMLEVVREYDIGYRTRRLLAYGFSRAIIGIAHREDSWWSCLKMKISFKSLKNRINHLQSCPKCKEVIVNVGNVMDYIKIVPGVVSLEDGKKAIRYLAKKNNMTEAEFREWMNTTSGSIIKEMNEADKPKSD
jgi:hypothetical protein